MEEMASLWSYQEVVDELKQKLLYTTLELQRLKVESMEEQRQNREYMKQLVQLVENACRERDEARNQMQKILSNFSQVHQIDHHHSPVLKANSGLTETNSFSPVESLLDPVSSPELSNIESTNRMMYLNQSSNGKVLDKGTFLIETLAKGKALPQKGRFLNAVLEAGPLLQTLLLAGPLPRWRNPPQLKPFHIPQVSVRPCDNAAAQPFFDMSCGSSSQMLLNFGSNVEYSGYSAKRQRLH